MLKKTVLNSTHRALGARMVDFGGWDMPVNYGSQIEEHHAVRNNCGMFDVSHMCPVDLTGADCRKFLSRLVANDVAKLQVSGKALYAAMLNDAGGVIDDLIIYFLTETRFRIVINAGTALKDLAWMQAKATEWGMDVTITQRRDCDGALAIIAVQGQITDLPLRANTGLTTLAFSSLPRMSTSTSSPIWTPSGRRARAMDCCNVGEKVPEVISPLPCLVMTF